MLRDAGPDDLGPIYDVWYATEIEGLAEPPPPRPTSWFGHLLGIGRLVVAVEGGEVVGFAGTVDHGRCVALSDLFVHPAHQSRGIGTALLDAVLPRGRALVTMASADPRAVGSYARRGMRPRWPAYYVAAAASDLRPGSWPDLQVGPMDPAEYPWQLPGDRDHFERLAAQPLVVHRDRQRAGSALTLDGSPQRLAHPETMEVLESCALDEQDAADLVLAVVHHLVGRGATRLALQVPGPHPALAPLLARGFRLTDVDMACATDATLLVAPDRHTLHGEPAVA